MPGTVRDLVHHVFMGFWQLGHLRLLQRLAHEDLHVPRVLRNVRHIRASSRGSHPTWAASWTTSFTGWETLRISGARRLSSGRVPLLHYLVAKVNSLRHLGEQSTSQGSCLFLRGLLGEEVHVFRGL